jgi:hypothetical protein
VYIEAPYTFFFFFFFLNFFLLLIKINKNSKEACSSENTKNRKENEK